MIGNSVYRHGTLERGKASRNEDILTTVSKGCSKFQSPQDQPQRRFAAVHRASWLAENLFLSQGLKLRLDSSVLQAAEAGTECLVHNENTTGTGTARRISIYSLFRKIGAVNHVQWIPAIFTR